VEGEDRIGKEEEVKPEAEAEAESRI